MFGQNPPCSTGHSEEWQLPAGQMLPEQTLLMTVVIDAPINLLLTDLRSWIISPRLSRMGGWSEKLGILLISSKPRLSLSLDWAWAWPYLFTLGCEVNQILSPPQYHINNANASFHIATKQNSLQQTVAQAELLIAQLCSSLNNIVQCGDDIDVTVSLCHPITHCVGSFPSTKQSDIIQQDIIQYCILQS